MVVLGGDGGQVSIVGLFFFPIRRQGNGIEGFQRVIEMNLDNIDRTAVTGTMIIDLLARLKFGRVRYDLGGVQWRRRGVGRRC